MKHKDFEMFYEIYYQPLLLYAISLTKNIADAEDIVANTFVKALLSFKKGNLEAWLYTVLKNEFYQFYKKRKRIIQENDFNINQIKDPTNILKELIKEEDKRWLYSQIYQLEKTERELMLLSLQTDLKDEEIARRLEISVENLRVMRHRVKQKLMKEAS